MVDRFRTYTRDSTDPMQYGNKQGVSTTHMLVRLLHQWHQALDSGHAIRVLYLDYSKAFDRVNHNILLEKLDAMHVHPHLLKWFASFLQDRQQCVRLGNATSSKVVLNGAVPQGAVFGMEGFIALVNDLSPSLPVYKYVDDSTTFEILKRTNMDSTKLHMATNEIMQWTTTNDMKINAQKTNEMVICFHKKPPNLNAIKIDGEDITTVTSTKLVGLHIQNDLKWDTHVDEITKKARKKLHFLQRLKRSKLTTNDLITFYKSVVVPPLEYACPAWCTSITKAQSYSIETIQRRALRMIYPRHTYDTALQLSGLQTLDERRSSICEQFFASMKKPTSALHDMLKPNENTRYTTRSRREYELPRTKTNRFKNSFVPYCLYNFQ